MIGIAQHKFCPSILLVDAQHPESLARLGDDLLRATGPTAYSIL